MKEKTVTIIPPVKREEPTGEQPTEKRKVAGYARVSTEFEEQQTSYEHNSQSRLGNGGNLYR